MFIHVTTLYNQIKELFRYFASTRVKGTALQYKLAHIPTWTKYLLVKKLGLQAHGRTGVSVS